MEQLTLIQNILSFMNLKQHHKAFHVENNPAQITVVILN